MAPLPRSHSPASLALSDTTYHSFRDNEPEAREALRLHPVQVQYRPASSVPSAKGPGRGEVAVSHEKSPRDSGYESSGAASRARRPGSGPRTTSTHYHQQLRSRPGSGVRRSIQSGPVSHLPKAGGAKPPLLKGKTFPPPPSQQQQQPITYYHFPHFPYPDPADGEDAGPALDARLVRDLRGSRAYSLASTSASASASASASPPSRSGSTAGYASAAAVATMTTTNIRSETPTWPAPPQTTHYWTSDRTRRLEYAAIDAASQGVRGWVRRHMVPDCFVPRDQRRVRFEDDRGSVVRYRIDLELEDSPGKDDRGDDDRVRRRRTWWFGMRD